MTRTTSTGFITPLWAGDAVLPSEREDLRRAEGPGARQPAAGPDQPKTSDETSSRDCPNTFIRSRLKARGGQALLELAVFGSIAIAALGFLIRVGMTMNYNQEVRMAAFRRALAAAAADNGTDQDAMGTTYHMAVNRQMPDPNDGYMSMQRMRTEASAFVMWGDRLTFAFKRPDSDTTGLGYKTQPDVIVRSDNVELAPFRQQDFPDDIGGVVAYHGVVTDSTTVNTSSGTIAQTGSATSLGTTTTATATTTLNTKNSDSIASSDSSTSAVSW